MNNKKRIYCRIFIVVGLIGLFLYLFVHLTYSFRDELANTKKNMAGYYDEENNLIDVVILGTSSTFSAVMPMKLWERYGISAYDFCTNVQFEESLPFSINEINKTQTPKLLIVDTAPFIYGHSVTRYLGDEATMRYNTDGYRISANRIKLINGLIPDFDERLYYYLDLLYYHENRNPDFSAWNFKKHNASKGYNNLHIDVSYTVEDERPYTDEITELSDIEKDNLNTLFDRLDNYSGDVLFMIVPYYNEDNGLYVNEKANCLRKCINEKGYSILDLSKERDRIGIDVTTDYSLDYLHFHVESAEKITDYIGKYLNENYSLPDHRDDINYGQWKADYEEWTDILSTEHENTVQYRKDYNNK